MTFSGDIWVLNKLAEFANRFGVSPAIANFEVNLRFDKDDNYHYTFSMVDGNAETDEQADKIDKMRALVGLDREMSRNFSSLSELERVVDQALSLAPPAPRPRARAR